MSVVSFNLQNRLTEKVYPISAPVGDRIDTTATGTDRYYDYQGARYRNDGTPESPQWVISETLDYAFKHGYGVIFNYSESDLNNNYIELDDSLELYDASNITNNCATVVDVVGAGGTIHFALWTENVIEAGQTVTKLHSSCNAVSNSGWYRPNYGYPPGVAIGTTSYFGVMDPIFTQNLYVPDGKKPKISFHVENAKHGDYLYNILVISGWYGYIDDSVSPPVVRYGVRWQRAISLSFAFGEAETIPGKTPSTTPNTTPAGGQGARNNFSYETPMPTAQGLSGLNYFAADNAPGLHLYKMDTTNWAKLLRIMWSSDWMKKITQALTSIVYGSTKAPADYILSCTKIALPVTIDGEPSATSNIYLGPVPYTPLSSDIVPVAKNLPTRYAETETWIFDIYPYSDTFLDFDGYTRIEMHVPYCGTVSISPETCMRGQIEIKYIVDLVSGGCCAIIRCKDQFGNYKIHSVLSGQCGISIPFAAQENTLDKIAGSIGSMVSGAASGNPVSIATGAISTALNAAPYAGAKAAGVSTAGGASAVLGDRSLYVAVFHPQDITGFNDDTPGKQVDIYGDKVGYPAAWFGTLGQLQTDGHTAGILHPYCECIVDPSTITGATETEKEYIRRALQGGVYL